MASVGEPLQIVGRLARPGGNVTGLSAFVNVLTSKRLGLTRELVPQLSRIGLFHNMSNPVAPPQWEETKTAAQSWGIEAELLDVRSREDIVRAFETAQERRVDALLVGLDGFIQVHQQLITSFSRTEKAACRLFRKRVHRGRRLLSYTVSYSDLYRRPQLTWTRFQRCQAGRPASATPNQIRTRDQPQNGQGAGPHNSADGNRPRRRGDRIGGMSAIGTKRHTSCTAHVRFWG